MFVVLVGYANHRDTFFEEVTSLNDDRIVWSNDKKTFYYIADLFVDFGGSPKLPERAKVLTWSGDHQETLGRIYKSLGLE